MISTDKLRTKLVLFEKREVENELLEVDTHEEEVKEIWCYIVPRHGQISSVGGTEVESAVNQQIIKCRKSSIKEPKRDMFFKDADGVKYEILDFFRDYKDRSFWEFRTKIVYE